MSRQRDTGGWTGQRDRAETWAEFDALPRIAKATYWFAPYDYTAIGSVRRWRNGADMRRVALRRRAAMVRDVMRESARLYGQAQLELQR